MKTFKILLLSIFVAVVLVLVVGCGRGERYGTSELDKDITSIGSILRAPADYEGKTVKVEGQIVRECPTGCWVDLKDDSGVIYVDFNPSAFAIPQRVNKKAAAQGKVKIKDGTVMIVGEGVEIK